MVGLSMADPIRVCSTAPVAPLVWDLLRPAVDGDPGIEVVDDALSLDDLPSVIGRADVVLVDTSDGGLPPQAAALLAGHDIPAVIGVERRTGTGELVRLVAEHEALGDLGPDELVRAVRRAAEGR
jgi:hypothetical protein